MQSQKLGKFSVVYKIILFCLLCPIEKLLIIILISRTSTCTFLINEKTHEFVMKPQHSSASASLLSLHEKKALVFQ